MPATTRDHVPARALFDGKHRPDSLILPSCTQCQKRSKVHELVAASVARTNPTPQGRKLAAETRKFIRRALKASPGLAEEMASGGAFSHARASRLRELAGEDYGGVFNIGPIMHEHMTLFGAKMTQALHYEHTGAPVRADNAISVRWYSNADRYEGMIPDDIHRVTGEPYSLVQGSWSVPDQFQYKRSIVSSKGQAMYFAMFRRAFAVLGIVWGCASHVPYNDEGLPTFQPDPHQGLVRIR